eukprot:TRINITY_DN29616_c0_g1_i1.p1 TRINITY_DN29616_c0_g1~~TRINITY_DN29616_c0_g1_i1.p1  ORF type:complete len:220 (-),score=47.73 TRINITY_DN29616_c0_g1_i1:17-676(-)
MAPEHSLWFLHAALSAASEPVTIVALGPLTNIAGLIRLAPELCAERVSRVVWMGGSGWAGGNYSPWAEANAAYDPEAAHIVLSSGLDITMYGLDAYLKVDFSAEELVECGAGLRQAGTVVAHPGRPAWCQLATRLLLRDMAHFEMETAQIGDAGAVAMLVCEEAVTTRLMHVGVELQGARTRGTVSYTHLRAHETPEHLVCRLLLEKKKKEGRVNTIYM